MSMPSRFTLFRQGSAGTRLLLAVPLGVLVGLFLLAEQSLPVRVAGGWVVAVAVFLGLTLVAIGRASLEQIRHRARLQDSKRWIILTLLVVAAGVSLLALGFAIRKVPDETETALILRIMVAGLTIVASWTLVHTVFALHYAHYFYGDDQTRAGLQDRGGLAFPGGDEPDYWDFLYFSFVVGMTCQVSDVQVTSKAMRRLTLMHGVLSFFFNTVILALAVNVVASSL